MLKTHSHYRLSDIKEIIDSLKISQKVKNDAYQVYCLIAEAESYAHQQSVEEVHFHEVGALDAVIDIVTVCYLIDRLKVDEIYSTPIATGKGYVKCAHGILSVPAPATAFLLKDIPHYKGDINSELCTPTGAALMKYFVKEYTKDIKETPSKTGYGFGKKELSQPNVLKAYFYDSKEENDSVIELQCNIDDMTGEELGYAFNKLLELGVKDVFTQNIMMKKSRPGVLLSVIIDQKDKEKVIEAIFRLTSTIGIREIPYKRYILDRNEKTYHTNLGKFNLKISEGFHTKKSKFEYDDLKEAADNLNLSLAEIKKILIKNLKTD